MLLAPGYPKSSAPNLSQLVLGSQDSGSSCGTLSPMPHAARTCMSPTTDNAATPGVSRSSRPSPRLVKGLPPPPSCSSRLPIPERTSAQRTTPKTPPPGGEPRPACGRALFPPPPATASAHPAERTSAPCIRGNGSGPDELPLEPTSPSPPWSATPQTPIHRASTPNAETFGPSAVRSCSSVTSPQRAACPAAPPRPAAAPATAAPSPATAARAPSGHDRSSPAATTACGEDDRSQEEPPTPARTTSAAGRARAAQQQPAKTSEQSESDRLFDLLHAQAVLPISPRVMTELGDLATLCHGPAELAMMCLLLQREGPMLVGRRCPNLLVRAVEGLCDIMPDMLACPQGVTLAANLMLRAPGGPPGAYTIRLGVIDSLARHMRGVMASEYGSWLVGLALKTLTLEEMAPLLSSLNDASAIASCLRQPQGTQLLHRAAEMERQLRQQRQKASADKKRASSKKKAEAKEQQLKEAAEEGRLQETEVEEKEQWRANGKPAEVPASSPAAAPPTPPHKPAGTGAGAAPSQVPHSPMAAPVTPPAAPAGPSSGPAAAYRSVSVPPQKPAAAAAAAAAAASSPLSQQVTPSSSRDTSPLEAPPALLAAALDLARKMLAALHGSQPELPHIAGKLHDLLADADPDTVPSMLQPLSQLLEGHLGSLVMQQARGPEHELGMWLLRACRRDSNTALRLSGSLMLISGSACAALLTDPHRVALISELLHAERPQAWRLFVGDLLRSKLQQHLKALRDQGTDQITLVSVLSEARSLHPWLCSQAGNGSSKEGGDAGASAGAVEAAARSPVMGAGRREAYKASACLASPPAAGLSPEGHVSREGHMPYDAEMVLEDSRSSPCTPMPPTPMPAAGRAPAPPCGGPPVGRARSVLVGGHKEMLRDAAAAAAAAAPAAEYSFNGGLGAAAGARGHRGSVPGAGAEVE